MICKTSSEQRVMDLLYAIGVLVLARAFFILLRTIWSYVPVKVDLQARFHSEWAFITGVNSGLGKNLALMIADQKINILGVGLPDDLLTQTQRECESRGVQFVPIPANLADLSSIPGVMEACGDRDVGIVLLNAGLGIFGPVAKTSDGRILNYLNLMCNSYSVLAREFMARNLTRKEKSVISITASVAANLLFPHGIFYCATKAFVSRLGQSLSLEGNTQLTVMHPGLFGSSKFFAPGIQKVMDDYKVFPPSEEVSKSILRVLGRFVMAEFSLNAVAFKVAEWIIGEYPLLRLSRFGLSFAAQ